MPFQIKDLMIDVSQAATTNVAITPIYTIKFCRIFCTRIYCSIVHSCGWCSHWSPIVQECPLASRPPVGCGPGSPVFDPGDILTNPAVLKEQLKAAMVEVEQMEKAQAESLKPQSLADVEMLEKKLTEAMEELRAQKAELQKRPK